MKNLILLGSLLALTLAGCKTGSQSVGSTPPQPTTQQVQAPVPLPPPPPPKFGWKQFHAETFETHPLQAKSFSVPVTASKLRVKIQAESAVFGGAISEARLIAFQLNHKVARTTDFGKMPCSLLSLDQGAVDCKIEDHERMFFIVRDARAEGTVASGLLGTWRKSHKLMEHGMLPNKIQISLSTWQCIENCRKSNSSSKD